MSRVWLASRTPDLPRLLHPWMKHTHGRAGALAKRSRRRPSSPRRYAIPHDVLPSAARTRGRGTHGERGEILAHPAQAHARRTGVVPGVGPFGDAAVSGAGPPLPSPHRCREPRPRHRDVHEPQRPRTKRDQSPVELEVRAPSSRLPADETQFIPPALLSMHGPPPVTCTSGIESQFRPTRRASIPVPSHESSLSARVTAAWRDAGMGGGRGSAATSAAAFRACCASAGGM